MNPVETYIEELREIRCAHAGVKEAASYSALANLLNEIGKTLKPRVRCILQLQNRGAGNLDGGLFTADQLPKGSAEPARAGLPARANLTGRQAAASAPHSPPIYSPAANPGIVPDTNKSPA